MTKAQIIQEIKRTAESNGGIPLGRDRFESETGIRKSDWYGIYWARWSEAVREAGFAPNQLQIPYNKEKLLEAYAKLAQEIGKLPTDADLNFKCKNDPEFPARTTFSSRLGVKANLVSHLIEYCQNHAEFENVLAMCAAYVPPAQKSPEAKTLGGMQIGFVYLLKHGSRREYKIGRTNNPLRREGEIGIELPEMVKPIHVIETDDPAGIEAYWHRRFADKRLKNEWFALTHDDVRDFKRWRRIV